MTSIARAFLFFVAITFSNAADLKVEKVEPPNWWTGMETNNIQLMIYGDNLKSVDVDINSEKIVVKKVHETTNGEYLFVDIELKSDLSADDYKITVSNREGEGQIHFPIVERNNENNRHLGFSSGDIIYLITPDRFANGDVTNDEVEGMINDFNPLHQLGRHGGDIQGIIDHLDYMADLGVTALWINPLVENNTDLSYHGYAATDLYKIDARFGTNELYRKLVDEAKKCNMKIILDHVSNHISINHPWMNELPMEDWIHGTVANHFEANHNKSVLSDIHADSYTKKRLNEGWFVDEMPDLNQANPFVHNYLIQNTIWWIEYAGLDGIREDTYPYADQKFLADWAKAIFTEYPNLNIVGEVWTGETPWLACYQKNSIIDRSFETNLPSVTDFAVRDTYDGFLRGDKTVYDIYKTFAFDHLYNNPNQLVTFLDNHDVARAMYVSNNNVAKVKLALTMLLTTRGIPQIYYGTEIGIVGGAEHGEIREDFPGGFKNTKRNVFIAGERNASEKDLYDFTKELIGLRKKYQVLSKGNMIQLPPFNNLYCYFRKCTEESMMIIVNAGQEEGKISKKIIEEVIGQIDSIRDVKQNIEVSEKDGSFSIPPMTANIYKIN